MKKEFFVYLKNARNNQQKSVMQRILAEGFCPFCPGHISTSKVEMKPVVKQGRYWQIRGNRWPYSNTRVHLLLILSRHAEKLSDLTVHEWRELLLLTKWAEKKYKLKGGGVCFRFGDPSYNGATVRHLHVHILVAKIVDKRDPRYEPVKFSLS